MPIGVCLGLRCSISHKRDVIIREHQCARTCTYVCTILGLSITVFLFLYSVALRMQCLSSNVPVFDDKLID
jgi:hypothetical protein